jgi:hypothetical protein
VLFVKRSIVSSLTVINIFAPRPLALPPCSHQLFMDTTQPERFPQLSWLGLMSISKSGREEWLSDE